jgi:hypothetical protein
MKLMADLKDYQAAAIYRPHEHFAFYGGVAVGKTFTGAHFSIDCMEREPDLMGLIGANNHDQLSQATMRELIYWLDEYGYDYVIDQRPPGQEKRFKTYKNIMSVRTKRKPKIWTSIFTRIMSAPNPLRGIEFSWYWLDETRDTPENTHDVVLSRMRESKTFRRGLITTTTNGEDWSFKRFGQAKPGQRLYGAQHVPTYAAVEKGTLSQDFYNMLRSSYTELLAQQELDALHVNIRGGRAYYAYSQLNESFVAPWGDVAPDRNRPLIVGCDFNFAPAPCVWMVGQLGPELYSPGGIFYGQCIHWFSEISATEVSTVEMAHKLINEYPGFFYRVFGDSSGMRGTTSNAGRHDYAQISETLYAARASFTIDAEQVNPQIKDRVENMNRLGKNALGEVRQTYNPSRCPLFHSDMKQVGWKPTMQNGRAKLDDGGNKQLTHASDGAGYAVYKLFPPAYSTFAGGTMSNDLVRSLSNAVG